MQVELQLFLKIPRASMRSMGVKLPQKPKAVELQKLRSELKEAFQVKETAALEERLTKLKQTDLLEKLNDIDYNNTSEIKP